MEGGFGRGSGGDSIEKAIDVAHAAGIHDGLDGGERPRVGIGGGIAREAHPRALQRSERRRIFVIVNLQERGGGIAATAAFHVLRDAFLEPGWRTIPRFLGDEVMRQFVLQDVAELRSDGGEPLDRDANAAVVERAGPVWGASDVGESLFRVENYSDGFSGRIIEFGFEIAIVLFESAENAAGEIGRGAAEILQGKVSGFAFAVAGFFFLIALRFFESVSNFVVGADFLGALPFRDSLVELIRAVISPAH